MQDLSATWRTSTYPSTNGGQCVEVAGAGTVLVRDTVSRDGVTLGFSTGAWTAFLATVRLQDRPASRR